MLRRRAAVQAAAVVLLSAAHLCAATIYKKPTARPGSCFNTMRAEIQASDRGPKGYGLIFYGDSITESLRGTDKCRSCEKFTMRTPCAGVNAVLRRWFGRYAPAVMGMSMDQTANLMWRLQSGEMPHKNQPRVAVINIGTNDLTNCGWSLTNPRLKQQALSKELPGILDRIKQNVGMMRRGMPRTHVVILGVLPRGTGSGMGGKRANENDMTWPSVYTKAIADLNKSLQQFAATDPMLSFVDCGGVFIRRGQIVQTLMTDAVHPTAAGWDALSRCLAPVVAKAWGP